MKKIVFAVFMAFGVASLVLASCEEDCNGKLIKQIGCSYNDYEDCEKELEMARQECVKKCASNKNSFMLGL